MSGLRRVGAGERHRRGPLGCAAVSSPLTPIHASPPTGIVACRSAAAPAGIVTSGAQWLVSTSSASVCAGAQFGQEDGDQRFSVSVNPVGVNRVSAGKQANFWRVHIRQ
jgi:hypothetical protein